MMEGIKKEKKKRRNKKRGTNNKKISRQERFFQHILSFNTVLSYRLHQFRQHSRHLLRISIKILICLLHTTDITRRPEEQHILTRSSIIIALWLLFQQSNSLLTRSACLFSGPRETLAGSFDISFLKLFFLSGSCKKQVISWQPTNRRTKREKEYIISIQRNERSWLHRPKWKNIQHRKQMHFLHLAFLFMHKVSVVPFFYPHLALTIG